MRYKLAPVRAQGRVRTAWELAVFAAAVLSMIVGPLAVAFGALLRAWYLVPALVVDVLFLADIAFRFNCAYVEQREEVRDRGRIAWRYIRRFFPLDLLAALAPLAADLLLLGGVLSGGTLPVFLVLSRLIKLPAASKNLFAVLPDQAAFGPARLVKMLFWLAVASHLISCGFLYIGAIPLGERPGLAWLQALYWTVTTIATIGYGTLCPTARARSSWGTR